MEVRAGRFSHRVVPYLSLVPIIDGAVCALDVDDTVLTTFTIFDPKGPTGANGKAKWRRQVTRLQHPSVLEWFQRADPRMTIFYLTARDPADAAFTEQELAELGLPKYPIVYDVSKGPALVVKLQQYGADRPVIFVDDREYNHRSVLIAIPQAQCYRVDPQLYTKLAARTANRTATK